MTVSRMFSSLIRVRVTVAYAAALFIVASVLLALGPHVQDLVVGRLSTNLHNLALGHLGTLLGSAFVNAEGQTYLLLPGLVCLMALAELIWRSGRLIQVFALGHIGATLIVAAGLAISIEIGWVPFSTTRASDVGLSYGAIAVLGTLTAAIPTRCRPAWISGWLTIALMVVASSTDFTAAGHTVALIIGMLLSRRSHLTAQWTVPRSVLLGVGIAFGLLLLVGVALPAAPLALAAGLGVALVAQYGSGRRHNGHVLRSTAATPPSSESAMESVQQATITMAPTTFLIPRPT
jgi:hypothetical protein